MLNQKDISINLVAGSPRKGKADREYFKNNMNDAEYRKQMFKIVGGFGPAIGLRWRANEKTQTHFRRRRIVGIYKSRSVDVF